MKELAFMVEDLFDTACRNALIILKIVIIPAVIVLLLPAVISMKLKRRLSGRRA